MPWRRYGSVECGETNQPGTKGKVGTALILVLVLGLRPWSQASRLDLRSGKTTVERVLSSCPGERRLILILECFMVYGVRNVQYVYVVYCTSVSHLTLVFSPG